MTGPYLGAHMSIAGGVSNAIADAVKVNAQALQIFTKNSNQWACKPLNPEEAGVFRERREKSGLKFIFAHDSYLINLASPVEELRAKSIAAFLDEMDRAEMLGLDFLVFHPGAHMNEGCDKGCAKISEALNRVIDQRPDQKVMLLIENSAGQGSSLGCRFEELALIRSGIENKARVGFCFDTCHAFAAGYDLRAEVDYQRSMDEFDRTCGIENLRAFHINDSKKTLSCHVDRHMHIGKGELGLEAFRFLLNDPRFKDRPMVLETPKSKDLHEDFENLGVLRNLLRN